MSFFAFHVHPSPSNGIARFLIGALCAAALGAGFAVFVTPAKMRGVWTSAPIVPGCINSGKGGSLCASQPAEKTSKDADCETLGRAGRLCFPAPTSDAHPGDVDRGSAP